MRNAAPRLSLIVPTYNERENVSELIERLSSTLKAAHISYELIFIDDRSPDGTRQAILDLHAPHVSVYTKQGEKGKAFSIVEGLEHVRGIFVGFIDADLQYPPEAIPAMLQKMDEADIVVAERVSRETAWYRVIMSRTFRFVFGKVLLGISVDSQSGLKIFRREAVKSEYLQGVTAWGLDYQMLYEAKRDGARFAGVPIVFAERQHGTSDVRALQVAYELMSGALRLRLKSLKGTAIAFFS